MPTQMMNDLLKTILLSVFMAMPILAIFWFQEACCLQSCCKTTPL